VNVQQEGIAIDGPSNLVPIERQQWILRRAMLDRVVKVRELADALNVHEMTIRRDLEALAEMGHVERVHGGARIKNQAGLESSYQSRAASNVIEKEAIARAAFRLIEEGDTVAFDASTTALALLRTIGQTPVNAIVISLDGAEVLASSGHGFLLIGGTFHAPARSFVGGLVKTQLERLHPDTVFFSAKGFTPEEGFTDAHLAEVETKERLIAASDRTIALLDHTKFGKRALGTIAHADRIDVLVTDRPLDPRYREAFEQHGVQIIVASESTDG
jgi:DeoR/GlpR family transcriptional regulator of sugar metabolism